MNKEIFCNAMEIGYLFAKDVNENEDIRVEEWSGTEDCATFAKVIIDYAGENGCDVSTAFYEIADDMIDDICNGTITVEDHGYDDYCRGFLAGEIIGGLTEENMKLVEIAEEEWLTMTSGGYYQDVLENVRLSNILKPGKSL